MTEYNAKEILGADKYGRWKVPLEVRESRIKICEECEFKKILAGVLTCGKCGCIMAAKARFKNTTCPINKW